MAIGDITKIDFATARDPDTGVEVTRVTDDQGDTIFPYFTQVVFTDDGRELLVSSNRTGAWQAQSEMVINNPGQRTVGSLI